MSRMSGDFPIQLPRGYLTGRLAVCCGLQCCPFVHVSCCSPNSMSTTCCGQVVSIFVRHAQFPRYMLARSSQGFHEDDMRKLLPWNFIFCDQMSDHDVQSTNTTDRQMDGCQDYSILKIIYWKPDKFICRSCLFHLWIYMCIKLCDPWFIHLFLHL